jgi:hypothetical protein
MTREEFLFSFTGFIRKRAESWLPEESTEEEFLEVMMQRLDEHEVKIMEVLKEASGS